MDLFENIKEQLTVALCKRCERSDVQVLGEKFWCAWCCKECEIFHKTIEAVPKSKFESLRVDAKGQIFDLNNVPVQPLRITSGWKVDMRNHLFEIDPTPETVKNFTLFNQTMLVMSHAEKNRLLDVGWTDEMNFEEGEYYLVLYEGGFHGTELYSYRGKDRLELVKQIESILEEVTYRAK